MLNNEALDVVIGIVLIYLLYSMLVTLVGEYVATKLGMRSRVLRLAIERMLNDGYYNKVEKKKGKPQRGQSYIARFFLQESANFKGSFAGKFYDYPAIKFLSRVEGNNGHLFSLTKPSYISPDYFADTLISILKDKSAGDTDIARVAFCLRYNTQHIQPQTLKVFQNHLDSAGNDIAVYKANLMKWFNETTDRSSGWFKRKMQIVLFILGFAVAATFNVDTIRIIRILSTDKEARNQLVTIGLQMAKDSAEYKHYLSAKADTTAGAVLDSGLSHVKRDIGSANFILGLGYSQDTLLQKDSFTLNCDAPDYGIVNKYAGQFSRLKLAQAGYSQRIHNQIINLETLRKDSAFAAFDLKGYILRATSLNPGKINSDTVNIKRSHLLQLRQKIRLINTSVSSDSVLLSYTGRQISFLEKPLINTGYKKINAIKAPAKEGDPVEITGLRPYNLHEKAGYILRCIWLNLAGLLLTGFALSMGAPFWFNLLNKLVSIRNSGKKPADEKIASPDGSNAGDIIVQAAVAAAAAIKPPATDALDTFTSLLLMEPGIVSIALSGNPQSLLVTAESVKVTAYLTQKYGVVYIMSNSIAMAIKYVEGTVNMVHSATCGGRIANKSLITSQGTLGGFLKRTGSDGYYFISCWHVMKDDKNYVKNPLEKDIVAITGTSTIQHTVIGTIIDGALTDKLDVGIASCKGEEKPSCNETDDDFKILKQYRPVTTFDGLYSTPVKILGAASGLVNAKIYQDRQNALIPYPDGKSRMIYDVFSLISPDDDPKAPTVQGDSGAVVIDEAGAPMGMIIGGNAYCSYAVKFTNMFDINMPYHGYYFTIKSLS